MNSTDLLAAMADPKTYSLTTAEITCLETHISWVFLTGEKAYKIKKPVNFGFLDYSTLEARKKFCQKEIDLNQLLAADIYLQVVTINETNDGLRVNGDGPIVEYAIEMAEFSQESLLDQAIQQGNLDQATINDLAVQIASFHEETACAPSSSDYGSVETLFSPVAENFEQARPYLRTDEDLEQLNILESWAHNQFTALLPAFKRRKETGKIKACHGDLHLGNITQYHGKTIIFDCIEFNESFRWIDTMAEIGFLVMDLYDHNRPDLASLFLNHYLEITGDYQGLEVLPFYIAYRAMVRAKIQLFNTGNQDAEKVEALFQRYRRYANLAMQMCQREQPVCYIMHGLSGSGKSTAALMLVEAKQAIRIRSDVERKRCFPGKTAGANYASGLYGSDETQHTYHRLQELTSLILKAGYSVTIDATSLYVWQRTLFIDVAKSIGVNHCVISCNASQAFLEKAISERQKDSDNVSDASLSVLAEQQKRQEPLSSIEKATSITLDIDSNDLVGLRKSIIHQLSHEDEHYGNLTN